MLLKTLFVLQHTLWIVMIELMVTLHYFGGIKSTQAGAWITGLVILVILFIATEVCARKNKIGLWLPEHIPALLSAGIEFIAWLTIIIGRTNRTASFFSLFVPLLWFSFKAITIYRYKLKG